MKIPASVATLVLALTTLSSIFVTPPAAEAQMTEQPTRQITRQSARVNVAVFAKGRTGTERLELRVDGKTVARFSVTTRLSEYNYSTTSAIGARALSVHFVNDAPSVGSDRSVTIDRVVVNGTQFQTEAATVEVLGAWVNGSCKRRGNHRVEHITCNGYARFDIGTAGRPQHPRPPAPKRPRADFPKAGNNRQVGCLEPCRVVGFQDFDGQKDAVLENVIITNPSGPCLSLRGSENITIRQVTLRNCANAPDGEIAQKKIIDIVGSTNVRIVGSLMTNNASRSMSNHDLIRIHNSTHVKIYNNEIRHVASDSSSGGADSGNRAILITGSKTKNVMIDRNDFFSPGRNAVQIRRARRITDIRITRNRIEGRARWNSDFEDMINFFSTTGTEESPIVVRGNYMRHGGPSASGTAIILGDGRGQYGTAYINVVNNVIVDPGHVGINVAGGHHFLVRGNTIYGGADVGRWTATGLTVNHYRYTPVCRDHRIYGNRVLFRNQFPQHDGTNDTWIPGTCTNNVRIHSNRFGDRTLTYDVWDL